MSYRPTLIEDCLDPWLAIEADSTRREAVIRFLMDLCEVMADASLCAMGGFTPLPVRSAIANFAADFHDHPHPNLTTGAHA